MTIVVVMGVSGSGKTTIAAGVARETGWVLLEGDAFHPAANIAKMQAGTPLTDADRWPWLHAIAARQDELRAAGQSAVVACSALKRAYRDILIGQRPDAVLVYLRGSKALITSRLKARKGHFMPPDEHPIIADIGSEPEATIAVVVQQLTQETP